MKKIVFLMPFYALPVPSTMGGGAEELMTILLEQHEKELEPDTEFYFITRKLYGKEKKYESQQTYKNSKVIKIKYVPLLNNCIRAINKSFKLLHINKRLMTIYYKKAYKEICKINPDLIISERDYDVINQKLVKKFGKDKISFHIHTQILDKENLDKYFGSLISVSNFISEDWKDFLGKNSPMNYYVLPNCVNEDRFTKQISKEEKAALRNKFGFSDNDFVSIFCGRICEDKGVDKIIDTILSLDEKYKLLIVGSVSAANIESTPFLRKIYEVAQNNPNRIKTTGYINNSELYKYYQIADVQLIPSMWEEAAGLVAVEGQICGIPQIITKSGGMVEFASPGGTIIINKDENVALNLKENIVKLSENPTAAKQMSEANKQHGLLFNKCRYYNDFIEISKQLIKMSN